MEKKTLKRHPRGFCSSFANGFLFSDPSSAGKVKSGECFECVFFSKKLPSLKLR